MKKWIIIGISLFVIILVGTIIYFYTQKTQVEIEDIEYFRFNYGGGMAAYSDVVYTFEKGNPSKVTIKPEGIMIEEAYTFEVSSSFQKKLESILQKYHTEKWNGFHKVDKGVMDGTSFSFYVKMKEKEIEASGYMMYPKDYRLVRDDLKELFEKLLPKEKE